MTEIQLAHFSWGEPATRDLTHANAIRDARTSGQAPTADQSSPRLTLAERLSAGRARLAFAGGPATTAECSCPA